MSAEAPTGSMAGTSLKSHMPARHTVLWVDHGREWRDIATREDCEALVRAFYGRALSDPIIGFIFVDVAKLDLDEHVPKVASFWETLLFGDQTYRGGAFAPHVDLHAKVGLQPGHFERWLALFYETLDEHFAGPRAEAAKVTAYRFANAFRSRLAHFPSPRDAAAPGGLQVTQHAP
jgi:hemoglobin